tara:strand:+ start:354 stop:716 length:363 start_codon:yes stop_codon:yes gene_type:complete
MIKMNIKELDNTLQMLKSTEEDFNIAVSNIKNLDLDPVYILLLGKELVTTQRENYIKEFPHINWPQADEFTYKALYNMLREKDKNAQDVFTHFLTKTLSENVLKINSFEFIENFKIKVKW